MLPAKACAAALLVFLAASPRDAGAVSADAIRLPPTKAGEVVRQQGPQPLPLSFQHGLAVERTIPITTLDALDVEALLAEDAQSEEITYRLGIGREITARADAGSWMKVEGGWIWSAEIQSTGAKHLRLHFTSFDAPPGAELQLYAPGDPQPPAPSYRLRGPLADGTFWSGILSRDRARIEYFEPGESAEPPVRVPFIVDALSHLYRSINESASLPRTDILPCHTDVMCFPDWANERDATAWITFTTSEGGTAFCTGTLLTTISHDFTPYVLTASHCISTAAEAQSAVFRWDFQTVSCDGSLPSSFPFSSVSSMVATNVDVDMTLLMVEGSLPASSVAWSGWDSYDMPFLTNVATIHHPNASFKRISFGTKAVVPSACLNPLLSDYIVLSLGHIDHGSSGGGGFRTDTHHLTGVLVCGVFVPSCSIQNEDVTFGRFSHFYPSIQSALIGGSDDVLEHNLVADNDQCDFATYIEAGTFNGLVAKIFDDDWYTIDPGVNEHVSVTVTYTHAFGDINLELHDGCGAVVASSNGTTGTESIDYVSTTGTPLKLRVFLSDDVRNSYNLALSLAPAPDLSVLLVAPGFDRPIVPRNAPDSYPGFAPLPPDLLGSLPSSIFTYLNWVVFQWPSATIQSPWDTRVYRDLQYEIAGETVAAGSSPGYHTFHNHGPITFPGGRHSLTSVADAGHVVAEGSEDDNIETEQFVWKPRTLPDLYWFDFAPAPHQGYLPLPNCDGYQGPGAWWGAFGISAFSPSDDYDLSLYDDYTGTLGGFESPLTASFAFGSGTDFVIWNGNMVGYGATRQVGVTRAYGAALDRYELSHENEATSTIIPTTYGQEYVSPEFAMYSGEVLKLHEVYLDASRGITYSFSLSNGGTGVDLNFALYGPDAAYYGRFDYSAIGASAGPGEGEHFDVLPSLSGWYVVAVWGESHADVSVGAYYQLTVGPAKSNLSEWITPVGGWADIIIPRNAPLASLPPSITPTLDGGFPTTRVNWEIGQLGPNSTPSWDTEAWIDGEPLGTTYTAGSDTPPGTYFVSDDGPYTVDGGRHTITAWVDPDQLVPESNETDNRADRQFIWSPRPLAPNVPMLRAAPPEQGYYGYYNSDGFQFHREPSDAWLVSTAPLLASSDCDLWVATDYSGSTAGFSDFPIYSLLGGDNTDFCVGSSISPYLDLYPEVTRAWGNAAAGGFVIDATTSAGKNLTIGSSISADTLESGHLANVYQFYMPGGLTHYLTLRRTAGTGTLRLEAFSEYGSTLNGRGSGSIATPLSAGVAVLAFTPPLDAWYPVVIYRENASNLDAPLVFDLHTATGYPTSVEAPAKSFEVGLAGAAPNPMRDATRIEFSLREEGVVRLDVFDLRGRRVRTLANGLMGAGRHFQPWDGRDEAGQFAGAGVFWARLEAGGRTFSKGLVVVP